jgi:hypothetical protein
MTPDPATAQKGAGGALPRSRFASDVTEFDIELGRLPERDLAGLICQGVDAGLVSRIGVSSDVTTDKHTPRHQGRLRVRRYSSKRINFGSFRMSGDAAPTLFSRVRTAPSTQVAVVSKTSSSCSADSP